MALDRHRFDLVLSGHPHWGQLFPLHLWHPVRECYLNNRNLKLSTLLIWFALGWIFEAEIAHCGTMLLLPQIASLHNNMKAFFFQVNSPIYKLALFTVYKVSFICTYFVLYTLFFKKNFHTQNSESFKVILKSV